MTRKESREQAFAIVFESGFHDEGLDYILENAADGRDLILNDGGIVPSPVFSRTTCGSSRTLPRDVSMST